MTGVEGDGGNPWPQRIDPPFWKGFVIQARGYKHFFLLSSAEHEIINVHKYKNIKKFSIFQAQISLDLEYYFSYL